MTMQDWIECVKVGGFIGYDGFGKYATKDGMKDSNKLYDVKPSDLKKGKVDKSWTHIVWYNR